MIAYDSLYTSSSGRKIFFEKLHNTFLLPICLTYYWID